MDGSIYCAQPVGGFANSGFYGSRRILVRLRPLGLRTDDHTTDYEILVTEVELEEAQEVLHQALQVRQFRELRTK